MLRLPRILAKLPVHRAFVHRSTLATMAYTTDTSRYKLNHSMLRVKDPRASVKFYEDNFGMKLINRCVLTHRL